MKSTIKEFVRSALALSTLIIAAVFGVSWIMCGYVKVMGLTFELIGLAFAVRALQFLIAMISFKNFILNFLVEYAAICTVVLGTGVALKWFSAENWWIVFLYVGIVYVAGFFLDMVSVKRDVDSINRMLEKRRKKDEELNDVE